MADHISTSDALYLLYKLIISSLYMFRGTHIIMLQTVCFFAFIDSIEPYGFIRHTHMVHGLNMEPYM